MGRRAAIARRTAIRVGGYTYRSRVQYCLPSPDRIGGREMSEQATMQARFQLGQIVATPGALVAIEFARANALELIRRHVSGDWGDLGDEDKQANEFALVNGSRLLSAYTLADGTRVWIITEADRSVSTILLPEEY